MDKYIVNITRSQIVSIFIMFGMISCISIKIMDTQETENKNKQENKDKIESKEE
jgi:hypothetical protein